MHMMGPSESQPPLNRKTADAMKECKHKSASMIEATRSWWDEMRKEVEQVQRGIHEVGV